MKYLPLLIFFFFASSSCFGILRNKRSEKIEHTPCKYEHLFEVGEISQIYYQTGDVFETGTGPREHSYTISFKQKFLKVPKVHVGLTGFDTANAFNQRLTVNVVSVSESDFNITFKTWYDTKVYLMNVNWIAVSN